MFRRSRQNNLRGSSPTDKPSLSRNLHKKRKQKSPGCSLLPFGRVLQRARPFFFLRHLQVLATESTHATLRFCFFPICLVFKNLQTLRKMSIFLSNSLKAVSPPEVQQENKTTPNKQGSFWPL